jgi:large subunit ribosomal protein L25
MNEVILKAHKRGVGKSQLKQVRKQKLVPGIFYTSQEQSVPIALAELELNKMLAQESALITLKMPNGQKRECVIRDIQRDPVWGKVLHVDLMGITRGQKVTVTVPLRLVGSPEGVKEGGILEHTLRELEIECLPRHLPSHLEVDVAELTMGESIRVEELDFENVKILTEPERTIATIVPPRVEKVAVEEVEAEEEEAEEGEAEEEEGEKPEEKPEKEES